MSKTAQYPTAQERDAARRYLAHSHAAVHLAGDARRQADAHATEIDDEHPRARDIALTGTERELGELPKHLRAHQRNERAKAGISSEQAAQIRREYRTSPPPTDGDQPAQQPAAKPRAAAAPAASSSPVSRAADYTVDRVSDAAGWTADTSWGSLIIDLFIGGVLLSLGYLLLTHAQGPSNLASGISSVVRAVVSPTIDPLNPGGKA